MYLSHTDVTQLLHLEKHYSYNGSETQAIHYHLLSSVRLEHSVLELAMLSFASSHAFILCPEQTC